jgi:hypothetical protein
VTTIMSLEYDEHYASTFAREDNGHVSVTMTGPGGRSWRGVRSDLDGAIELAGRMLAEQRAAAVEDLVVHTISGAFIGSEDGGQYVVSLLQGGALIRAVGTASPAVAAAAAYLMEKSTDPVALVDGWGPLDHRVGELTVGDGLVVQAEALQAQGKTISPGTDIDA